MPKKYVALKAEFSSSVPDRKWLNNITVYGFSNKRPDSNERFWRELVKIIREYNTKVI